MVGAIHQVLSKINLFNVGHFDASQVPNRSPKKNTQLASDNTQECQKNSE